MHSRLYYMNFIFKHLFLGFFFSFGLQITVAQNRLLLSENILDFTAQPTTAKDRKYLAFSDQGAWFAYGFLPQEKQKGGFAGPFIMTEQNGVWLTDCSTSFELLDSNERTLIQWEKDLTFQRSYLSHLEQEFENKEWEVHQKIVFYSAHTAVHQIEITNKTQNSILVHPQFSTQFFIDKATINTINQGFKIETVHSNAVGYCFFKNNGKLKCNNSSYSYTLDPILIKAGAKEKIQLFQSFIFPEHDFIKEKIAVTKKSFEETLSERKKEKEKELESLFSQLREEFKEETYQKLVAKIVMTLQNNTRKAAGGIYHDGLFPSYHYEWFNGFWAWDSWKHAVGVAQYNTELAENQIRAMFDFQEPNGFIPDCIFRDTSIEKNNYRNTKSPLSAWAVWEVFLKSGNKAFLEEMFSKLEKYHYWWYKDRDHDKDGLCEFGATDGTLEAAKWESGMDNAVRFDHTKLLKNHDKAYSMNQESVDLNTFLWKEKHYLEKIAKELNQSSKAKEYCKAAKKLEKKIRTQFWDEETQWFYDTNLEGNFFIKEMGCEGYLPLWAKLASSKQAKQIKNHLMNPQSFNTHIPLPTLAANHLKFKPNNGYWRGPIWLDQTYFGIKGLENYGFMSEAHELKLKVLKNTQGLLKKGVPIRENYQPISGEGLEASNFSWSAVHLLLLLLK